MSPQKRKDDVDFEYYTREFLQTKVEFACPLRGDLGPRGVGTDLRREWRRETEDGRRSGRLGVPAETRQGSRRRQVRALRRKALPVGPDVAVGLGRAVDHAQVPVQPVAPAGPPLGRTRASHGRVPAEVHSGPVADAGTPVPSRVGRRDEGGSPDECLFRRGQYLQ